jgi:hypothetical protein
MLIMLVIAAIYIRGFWKSYIDSSLSMVCHETVFIYGGTNCLSIDLVTKVKSNSQLLHDEDNLQVTVSTSLQNGTLPLV